jgi:hypothetical protein
MAMPTTRRGRYLVYRKRAVKRMARLRKLKRRGGRKGHRQSGRERDYSSCVKQYPRAFKGDVGLSDPPRLFAEVEAVPGEGRGFPPRWNLVGNALVVLLAQKQHVACVNVVKRRVLHVPHLRRLPLIPYDGGLTRNPPWVPPDEP